MPSVLPKLTDPRPSHKADEAIQAIEYAMQELVESGATADDVNASGSYVSNDSDLVAAIVTSLAARS